MYVNCRIMYVNAGWDWVGNLQILLIFCLSGFTFIGSGKIFVNLS